jgi:hypothetical protein
MAMVRRPLDFRVGAAIPNSPRLGRGYRGKGAAMAKGVMSRGRLHGVRKEKNTSWLEKKIGKGR